MHVQVGDFGMSRDLADSEYYLSQGGIIPLRWTAPEAIYFKKYSTASDIWSYGCLLFEIWSVGRKPFDEVANTEVKIPNISVCFIRTGLTRGESLPFLLIKRSSKNMEYNSSHFMQVKMISVCID